MRPLSVSAAVLAVALVGGSSAPMPCVADETTSAPEPRREKLAPARSTTKLDRGRKLPRYVWSTSVHGRVAHRRWPYIDPRPSHNYWVKWNAPSIYRDPNVYVLYSYDHPFFVYPVHPLSRHRLVWGF